MPRNQVVAVTGLIVRALAKRWAAANGLSREQGQLLAWAAGALASVAVMRV
ncbi:MULTISPECIES: hypothetical protein [unclassified Streptomyces]|uniref:hypothetical protein n=1 Tax=unclassified Streptomyces TaxID=2593676 RepID=UPI002DDB0B15|nr:hypothetical protein [Streptomyces sp. NBC_01022]WRZ86152.1 hypothetical protein OG316_40685 [Streptomyces sp. NBC_01022]